ncbi:hypothetical protein HUO13_20940 [Saccharopolyspora erythraea]|uniref:YncE family protein n=1 Tax=Saccharopolyspora erythraea TaxID=1836 RepID=UPI001BA50171|nr:hypothetical protein [Saccharopolyspora erythraea]QUH02955.1 hypothetical protein HUO13_20940 [Saccharopolyspora erythraea]
MRRLAAACITASLALAGCADNTPSDPLQVTDQLTAATPATAPPTQTPAGTILPTPAAQHSTYDTTTHTLITAAGPSLTLTDTRAPGHPPRTIGLPGTPAALHATGGTLLAALPDQDLITRTDLRTGQTTTTRVPGGPTDATPLPDGRTAVALRTTKTVTILDGDRSTTTATGFQGPAQLLTTGNDLYVLDRLTTAITPIDPATGEKGAGLRAGDGATNAVTDRYHRILAVDTRGQELLAFSVGPLIMKQRYPVPGAPYDIAYDPHRDLAWITLTATNELIAYDIAGGEPRQRHRLPTVHQPDSVTIDPDTGEVYVTSATGQGTQVVKV